MRAMPTLLATALVSTLCVAVTALGASPKPKARSLLPASESTAKTALEASPRHGELVDVPYGSNKPIRTWVVYPEMKDKAGVVLIIHEIFGLSDWIRGVADQLARDGFVAVAPDLISGMGPNGGGTESVASRDDVTKLIRGLSPEETAARLDAARAYAASLPASNGKLATMGFCWGGSRSFEYSAHSPPPQAAVVFYGASPDSSVLVRVQSPVLGLYGGDDARVTSTIEPARARMRRLDLSYEAVVYPGAGHGFLRMQEDRNGANLAATQKAWPRAIRFLRQHLK